MMINAFSELELEPQLVQAVADLGYSEPTPIQMGVIPLMLSGVDVIGQAQTGTGKTAAFALPLLQNLDRDASGVQALVLTPTRELAIQVAKATTDYGQHKRIRVLAIYGGQSYDLQIGRLRRGVDVVVGTPGRLMDLMDRGVLDLSMVRTLVMDEADEMLSMGFIEDIETVLSRTPDSRQTALFSATMPPSIRRLANKYMREPQSVAIAQKQRTVEAIEQRYYLVNHADKTAALTRLLEVEPITSTLIFVRTRLETERLTSDLKRRGFPAEAMSGELSQKARERVIERFRQQQSTVVVATDVAARGLDIDDISHVFNYDLPQDPESYVHRIGRTGRAGRTGVAITLVTPNEQWLLRRIEGFAKQRIPEETLPTKEMILALRENALLERIQIWLRRGRYRREREMVEAMIEEGFDPVEIAAAAIKVARAEEKDRPIAEVSPVYKKSKSHLRDRKQGQRGKAGTGGRNGRVRSGGKKSAESRSSREAGMTRLNLNRGRSHGIRPNDVVSTLAFYADIPGSSIGKILIDTHETLVDVPEQFVEQVLAQAGRFKMRKQNITVERA
ncbi:MAG: DEAD/DEAH box helicase [Chloroflexota bacterium]